MTAPKISVTKLSDDEVRVAALNAAVRLRAAIIEKFGSGYSSQELIISDAKKFERYIKEGK